MKLYLSGHAYRYAVEQMLLTLFPEERPLYPEEAAAEGEAHIRSTLRIGTTWATAGTHIFQNGRRFSGAARCRTSALEGRLAKDRALQRIIKLSFFRAARDCTGETPPWGALTGIRPAKTVIRMLEQGAAPGEAEARLGKDYYVTPARRRLCVEAAEAGYALKRALPAEEMSLYIGIPFCPTRCAYCSFVSHSVEQSMKLVEPYLQALSGEIRAAAGAVREAGRRIGSVYIGGGTPTTLSAEQLASLLALLGECFDLSACAEYTVEAGRPDTITAEKLAVLRRFRVGRVSVNPQTMEDPVLTAIGRGHTAAEAVGAVSLVRDAGPFLLNMDLIAGLPGDSEEGFRRSVEAVLALRPENITVHTLARKRGSRLRGEERQSPCGGEETGAMLDAGNAALRAAGYRPYYLYRQKFTAGNYENVGWSLPRHEGRYNICMMEELHTVLALGAGGVTKLVEPETGRIRRLSNPKYPYEYIDRIETIMAEKMNCLAPPDTERHPFSAGAGPAPMPDRRTGSGA